MSEEAHIASSLICLPMNIISIIIGLVIWLVVPILTNEAVKKKSHRKAIAMLCRIVGIAIIAIAVFNFITSLFS